MSEDLRAHREINPSDLANSSPVQVLAIRPDNQMLRQALGQPELGYAESEDRPHLLLSTSLLTLVSTSLLTLVRTSAMPRAKIDLRHPASHSGEDHEVNVSIRPGLRNTRFPRFIQESSGEQEASGSFWESFQKLLKASGDLLEASGSSPHRVNKLRTHRSHSLIPQH